MSSSILPGRFDNGDVECWLREFNACCNANGWKVTEECDDKILKPGIRTDVENYVKKCTVCAHRTSPVNLNRAPMGNIAGGEPFTFWAMDYMGPLPETTQGNKHILVVVDHFTKWCEAFATPDQKASTVASLLISRIFSRFGPPAVLHSDQGHNFESVLMHEICDSMGITKTRTTAYHPQCDGQTERQNRTLQNMLSSFA